MSLDWLVYFILFIQIDIPLSIMCDAVWFYDP